MLNKRQKQNKIIKYKDYAEIIIINSKIGEVRVKIDLEDIDKIKEYTWNIKDFKNHYIMTKKTKHIKLHRYLMNAKNGEFIDHINRDIFDNRKSNLRILNSNFHNSQNRDLDFIYEVKGKYKFEINNKYFKIRLYFDSHENALEFSKTFKVICYPFSKEASEISIEKLRVDYIELLFENLLIK